MKIAHVVTLVSPDGAYGGPLRVAINLLKELKKRGHDVRLFAAYKGQPPVPSEIDGISLTAFPVRRLIPKTGFAGLTSFALLARLARDLRGYDIIHVHLARDLVTLPAAFLALLGRRRVFIQTHGMIDRSRNLLAVPLDLLMTRPVLARARAVFYLTARERDDLITESRGRARLIRLENGVPKAEASRLPHPELVRFLFLARLASIKQPTLYTQAAIETARSCSNAEFALVGPDEGEASKVKKLIAETNVGMRIRWEGALAPSRTLERMAASDCHVLTSKSDVAPMSVLEAASLGLPLIVTSGCGFADVIKEHGAGFVVGPTTREISEAMRMLASDSALRQTMGGAARKMVQERFSIEGVVERLLASYSRET